jgi:hypothetical protein
VGADRARGVWAPGVGRSCCGMCRGSHARPITWFMAMPASGGAAGVVQWRCGPPRIAAGVLRRRRMLSVGLTMLVMLALGVVTLTLGPIPATAAPDPAAADVVTSGLPEVTVHVTTAPLTNLTTHTGVTRTTSCPTGTVMVGGGGDLRNATNPATVPNNGLVLGGSNPSTGASPVDQPVANAATTPSNWMAIANFTGQSEPGDQAAVFALCATGGLTRTVVSSTTTTGANATQQGNPPTLTIATCPAGTRLIGGGAFTNTPDQVNDGTTVGNNGNLKPMGRYPSDSSGVPAADGSTSATSWSAYGSAGVTAATDAVTSLALCTSDPTGPVQVARQDASFTSTPSTAVIATPVCPTGTQLLGGGFRVDETVNGTAGLQPQQGYHLRGSYPSTGSATPPAEVSDATTNPTTWTTVAQAGGAPASGTVVLHAFALCAQPSTPVVTPAPSVTPTPGATPTPSVIPTPGVTPTPSVAPVPSPEPGVTVTTTRLYVMRVPLPFGLGGVVIPIAVVSPRNAAGTVQFKDGTTNLGGPVAVTGGVTIGPIMFISFSPHSLTAVFTPTNSTVFQSSTSNTVDFTFPSGPRGHPNRAQR